MIVFIERLIVSEFVFNVLFLNDICNTKHLGKDLKYTFLNNFTLTNKKQRTMNTVAKVILFPLSTSKKTITGSCFL